MSKKQMRTHRCEGSLKNEVSIRYTKQYRHINALYDYEAWRLFKLRIDSEYDSKYLSHISEIKFCPYCGKELEEVKDEMEE